MFYFLPHQNVESDDLDDAMIIQDEHLDTDYSKSPNEPSNIIELIKMRIKVPCRTEWGIELPFDIYILDTCARCYHYMPSTAFKSGARFK